MTKIKEILLAIITTLLALYLIIGVSLCGLVVKLQNKWSKKTND